MENNNIYYGVKVDIVDTHSATIGEQSKNSLHQELLCTNKCSAVECVIDIARAIGEGNYNRIPFRVKPLINFTDIENLYDKLYDMISQYDAEFTLYSDGYCFTISIFVICFNIVAPDRYDIATPTMADLLHFTISPNGAAICQSADFILQ